MDALSELLRAVKLSGAMFYVAEGSKPWRVLAPPSSKLGKYVAANASHVIEFHLVTHGSGYVRVGEETTPFSAGDLLMIPHGDAHEMGNGSGAPLIDSEPGMAALLTGGIQRSRFGGGGEETRLICGYLACEAGLIRPVLAGLPRVVRVHITQRSRRRMARKLDRARRRARVGRRTRRRRDPRAARGGAVRRGAAALCHAAADGAHRLARGRRRRDGRATASRRCIVSPRIRGRSTSSRRKPLCRARR